MLLLLSGVACAEEAIRVVGVWNGFHEHTNIIECVNPSAKKITATLRLTNSAREEIASVPFRIVGKGTVHLPLNDYPIQNDYGLFEITLKSGRQPFCSTTFYRFASDPLEEKQVQYAFSLPAGRALRGTVSGTYNSMNPEGTATPVHNWLSIYNLSEKSFSAKLEVYRLDGTLDTSQSRTLNRLRAGERRDIPLGHELGQQVGMYRIVPKVSTQEYGSVLSRFSLKDGNRYNFSFPLIPSAGSCDTGPIPTSTMGGAQNWLEIANASSEAGDVVVALLRRDGTPLLASTRRLAPRSQLHIDANQYLGANSLGWFRVRCKNSNKPLSILAQSIFYGFDPLQAQQINWAYASQSNPYAANAKTFVSTYNTFLEAANWLKLLNPNISAATTEVGLYDATGSQQLRDLSRNARSGALDYDIHSQVGSNTFGFVTTHVSKGTFPNAELIRVYPTASGNIGYIMNPPTYPALMVNGEPRWMNDQEGGNSIPGGGSPGGGGGSAPNINKAPVAKNGKLSTTINVAKSIKLVATDVDSPSLSFEIVSQPVNGSLSGTAPHLTYTPSTKFYGADSFRFRAFDGKRYSNTATVSITVVNEPGMCSSITVKFAGHTKGDYPPGATVDGVLFEDGKTDPISYDSDITFSFDKPYPCGQFVTDDWWVKGPVTVTRITPDHANDRNGYDVNPAVQHQSFDSRIDAYQVVSEVLPLTLDAGDGTKSLVKSVSYNPDGNCQTIVQNRNLRSCLLSVAILTVLKEIPSEQSFRPPYIAGNKPLVPVTSLDLNKLPRLPKLPETLPLTTTRKFFGGPYIDHILNWTSRFIHPRANMRDVHPLDSVAYGARLATVINEATLSTMHDDPNSEKVPVVIPLTQWGLDLYHQLLAGQYWPEAGGHELGRKLPILYAGKLLSSSALGDAMLNMAYTYRGYGSVLPSGEHVSSYFQEDEGIYYGENNVALFGGTQGHSGGKYGGQTSYSQLLNSCNGSKTARDPNGLRDGGILYFDHNDPNTMPQSLIDYLADFGPGGTYVDENNPPVTVTNQVGECGVYNAQLPTIAQQMASGQGFSSPYQGCCTSKQYAYTATAAKLLDLKEKWNHPAFFDYIERWNGPPWNGEGGYGSVYGAAMFRQYYNPRSYNQTAITTTGILIPITLQAVDAQGDALTYQIVTGPSHGTLSSNDGDSVVRYTSSEDFSGVDSFTFRVSDGVDLSNVSTVTVIVNSDPGSNVPWNDNFDTRMNGSSDLETQTIADQLLWSHFSQGKAAVVDSLGSKWLRMSGASGLGDIFVVAQPTFSEFELSFDVQKPWTSRAGFVFYVQDNLNFYYMIFSDGIGSAFPGANAPNVIGGLYKVVQGVAYLVDSNSGLRIPHHGQGLIDSFSVRSTIVAGALHFEISRKEKNYGTGATFSDTLVDPTPSFTSGKFGFLTAYEPHNVALFDNIEIQELE